MRPRPGHPGHQGNSAGTKPMEAFHFLGCGRCPAKWTTLLRPGPGNSEAKGSMPLTSARCSGSPAPRSSGTLFRQYGERFRQRDDYNRGRATILCKCPACTASWVPFWPSSWALLGLTYSEEPHYRHSKLKSSGCEARSQKRGTELR
jgi:hypothetical protein